MAEEIFKRHKKTLEDKLAQAKLNEACFECILALYPCLLAQKDITRLFGNKYEFYTLGSTSTVREGHIKMKSLVWVVERNYKIHITRAPGGDVRFCPQFNQGYTCTETFFKICHEFITENKTKLLEIIDVFDKKSYPIKCTLPMLIEALLLDDTPKSVFERDLLRRIKNKE